MLSHDIFNNEVHSKQQTPGVEMWDALPSTLCIECGTYRYWVEECRCPGPDALPSVSPTPRQQMRELANLRVGGACRHALGMACL
jgi:hypothetical protein